MVVGRRWREEIGRPLFIDPRRRLTANPLPRPTRARFLNRFRSVPRGHTARVFFFSPLSYILHRFRLRFDFFVLVFHPSRALQHGHLILPADQEKYAYGGGDHYYIGIGNGGSGCSNNIVIIII